MDGRGGVTQRSIACAVDLPGLPPRAAAAVAGGAEPAAAARAAGAARPRPAEDPLESLAIGPPRRGSAHHHLGARARHRCCVVFVWYVLCGKRKAKTTRPAELVNSLDAEGGRCAPPTRATSASTSARRAARSASSSAEHDAAPVHRPALAQRAHGALDQARRARQRNYC